MLDLILFGVLGFGLVMAGVFIAAVILGAEMERKQSQRGGHCASKKVQTEQSVDHRHWCCETNQTSVNEKQGNDVA